MPGPSPHAPVRAPLAGTIFVLAAAACFSAKAVIIKMAYAHPVDAATLLTLRMLFSAPFFVLMALWSTRKSEVRPLTRKQWISVLVLGFTGYYLASYLDFLGLQYITAGLERLILFLYPTIVVLLSAWWLRKPIRRHHIVALVLSYGGIALVFTENLNFGGHAHEVALGGALVFASGVVYSFYLIGAGETVGSIGAMRFTAYAMLVACVVSLLQFFVRHDVADLRLPHQVYWLALTMAILSTVIPAWLMSEGIRLTGANHAAMVGSVGPVVTIFLGYWFLGEPITAMQVVGGALVLSGVTLVSLRR
ncbi:MAG TPA: DMT family transporter [Burkholderiales bacterium]|jgi:drug/metabolite transporter (DMT)-like permease|nr:DMT family transporter [Burkholderiales bacterium]